MLIPKVAGLSRRKLLLVIGTIILIGVLFRLAVGPAQRNLILITLDTTRADRLGCYGHQDAWTPVMDALAKRGVLFERAYAPVPLTLPSHATMFTGLYPPEHGVRNNGQGALPGSLPTLATELQRHGYETAAFVAAFVLDGKFGLNRGFQTYSDDMSQADESQHGHHRYRDGRIVVDSAIRWIERRKKEPYFCWIHLFDPHFPYLNHEDIFKDRFADQPYDAELAYVDRQLGRLIEALEKSGQLETTTIVIAGDHGECLGEHGERAHGMTLYESALRVPLLIVSPGQFTGGHRVKEPVSLVDLCPTLLDCLLDSSLPDISGRSLRPALLGETLPPRECYAETDEPYQTARWSPLRALIDSEYKFVRSPQPELYKLTADPGELKNLAADEPERAQAMEEQLSQLEQGMGQRVAQSVLLTDRERLALTSLGYAAPGQESGTSEQALRDVKEMLPYYNMLNDATEMMDSGHYDLAEPVLREVLAADQNFFLAHGDLGRCLLRLGKQEEAIIHLKRSVELDPGADRVRAMLGAALLLNGQHEEAVTELETTLRLNAELYESRYNLGLALEKLGRIDEAAEQYRGCLKTIPYFTPAQQRLEALKLK
jgi:arylsulfatase A-like enzyme/Tfp pilus assembly protein PilF